MDHAPSDAAPRKQETSSLFKPYRWAMGVASGYLLLAGVYIIFSGEMARRLTDSVEQLKVVEQVKGIVYVVVTAILLYLVLVTLLRRIHEAQLALSRQNSALIRAERQSSAAVFARSVAHDINNVLTVLAGQAHMIARAAGDDRQLRKRMDTVNQALDELKTLSTRLRDLGKQLPNEQSKVDLRHVVEKTLDLAVLHHRLADCHVETRLDDVGTLTSFAPLIQQSVMNLLLNAAEAVDGQGHIRVSLSTDRDTVTLVVEDDGPGIDPSKRDDIFTPFISSKSEGSGLGLVSVKACAEAHDGAVHIDDSPLGGARFVMTLKRDPRAHIDPTAVPPHPSDNLVTT